MAVKLAKIINEMQHGFIEVKTDTGTEKVEFSYRGYSPAVAIAAAQAVSTARAAGDFTTEVVETLTRVLTHVGITDDDGKAIAITHENLMQVPFEILNGIFAKIVGAEEE